MLFLAQEFHDLAYVHINTLCDSRFLLCGFISHLQYFSDMNSDLLFTENMDWFDLIMKGKLQLLKNGNL